MKATDCSKGIEVARFVDAGRKQRWILPPSIDEMVPADHPVRLFDEIITGIDAAALRAKYKNDNGRPAYEPTIVLRILLWAYLQGEQSSRKIARACCENIVYMYLAGSYRPDFRTLCLFRKSNREEFRRVLKETLKVGKEMSPTSFAHTNIDGTKVRADASAGAQSTEEQLDKQAQELAEAILRKAEEVDAAQDKEFGEGDGYAHLPKTLQGKADRLRRIKEAKKKLSGSPDAKTANVTDPESTYIKDLRGPGYNAQAAVDSESRLITADGVTSNPSDNAQLVPMVKAHKENTGTASGTAAADAGYSGGKNLRDSEDAGYEPYIPQKENLDAPREKKESGVEKFGRGKFKYEEDKDAYRCPAGKLLEFHHHKIDDKATGEVKIRVYKCSECTSCGVRHRCTDSRGGRELHISEYDKELRTVEERLSTSEGRKRYKKRKSTVETVFGYIKRLMRFRRFSLRGLLGVCAEWSVVCAAYNIRRLMTLKREDKAMEAATG